MRTIRFLLQKEFLQIFRNKGMLPIIFLMPVIQLVVLSFAATYELKEVDFHLVNFDHSSISQRLVSKFQASGYFTLQSRSFDVDDGIRRMRKNEVDLVLVIPPEFGEHVLSGKPASVQLNIDAVDGVTAGLIMGYSRAIIRDFSANVHLQINRISINRAKGIKIIPASWYNPNLDYINFMVPGILAVLVSMIGMFLSGMNIVREREMGTIEQLNVTPIMRYQFIIGKLLPFWIIGLFELIVGLIIAHFILGVPFLGSVWLLLAVAGIFLLVVQGIGLFISTITDTQQQAMFIAWFLMVVFILMGGLFTPIESMPDWAEKLTFINPIAYFIKIMRMVMLKGSGWNEVWRLAGGLALMAVIILPAAVLRYRKSTI
ncbi:MAG TPA: ABC transporter permease [Balneolaceae bacterium]|nr:ABC transporter permease [Balneolaceae bacterium]